MDDILRMKDAEVKRRRKSAAPPSGAVQTAHKKPKKKPKSRVKPTRAPKKTHSARPKAVDTRHKEQLDAAERKNKQLETQVRVLW